MRKLTLLAACLVASATMLAQNNTTEVRTMTVSENGNPKTFLVSAVDEVTFGTETYYQIEVSGQDNGTVSGEGYYALGSKVMLTATPDENHKFVSWTVDGDIFYVPTITIEVKVENSIAVEFAEAASPFDPVNGHAYVDLGLSVMWATYNVGVDESVVETLEEEEYKTELFGDYYAWGELEANKAEGYSWSTYAYGKNKDKLEKYCTESSYGLDGFTDDKITLDPEDDVAHIKWGGSWRMPTKAEWAELFNAANCDLEWTTNEKGVYGLKITSKKPGYKDAVLFLPAAGYRSNFDLYEGEEYGGNYWMSSIYAIGPRYANCVIFDINDSRNIDGTRNRYYGQSVRPVLALP